MTFRSALEATRVEEEVYTSMEDGMSCISHDADLCRPAHTLPNYFDDFCGVSATHISFLAPAHRFTQIPP